MASLRDLGISSTSAWSTQPASSAWASDAAQQTAALTSPAAAFLLEMTVSAGTACNVTVVLPRTQDAASTFHYVSTRAALLSSLTAPGPGGVPPLRRGSDGALLLSSGCSLPLPPDPADQPSLSFNVTPVVGTSAPARISSSTSIFARLAPPSDGVSLFSLVWSASTSACRMLLASIFPVSGDALALPLDEANSSVVVSDTLPPAALQLAMPLARPPGEVLSLHCASSNAALLTPSPASLTVGAVGDAGDPAGSLLPAIVLLPVFQGLGLPDAPLPVNITCALNVSHADESSFQAYGSTPAATLANLVFQRRGWPLLSDVLQPPLDAGPLPLSSLVPADSGAVFELLLSRNTSVTLMGDAVGWARGAGAVASFPPCLRVLVGEVAAELTALAADRHSANATMPPLQAVCAEDATRCSLAPLTLQVPIAPGYALSVSCPPFCPTGGPQVLPSEAPLVRRQTWQNLTDSIGGGWLTGVCAGWAPPAGQPLRISLAEPAPGAPPRLGGGVQYFSPCLNRTSPTGEAWLDPRSAVCSNRSEAVMARLDAASLARARLCPFGSGANCSLCPSGAHCPGDFRAWPRPGFWSSGETDPDVRVCLAPQERCLGWSAGARASKCAAGYAQERCSDCDAGYFPLDEGEVTRCSACPTSNAGSFVLPILYLLLGLAALALGLISLTMLTVHALGGGDIKGVGKQLPAVVAWVWSVLQAQVTLARFTTEGQNVIGVPPALRALYRSLRVLNFDGLSPHPACLGAVGKWVVGDAVLASVLALSTLLALSVLRLRLLCGCCGRAGRVLGLTDTEREAVEGLLAGRRLAAAAEGLLSSAASQWSLRAEAEASALSATPHQEALSARQVCMLRLRHLLTRCRPALSAASQRVLLERSSAEALARLRRERLLRSLPLALRTGFALDARRVGFQYALIMALTLLYPKVLQVVIGIQYCAPASVSVARYRTLLQDGSALRAAGIPAAPWVPPVESFYSANATTAVDPYALRMLSVQLLVTDRFVVCGEGGQAARVPAARAVTALYLVGFPLACFALGMLLLRRWRVAGREGEESGIGKQDGAAALGEQDGAAALGEQDGAAALDNQDGAAALGRPTAPPDDDEVVFTSNPAARARMSAARAGIARAPSAGDAALPPSGAAGTGDTAPSLDEPTLSPAPPPSSVLDGAGIASFLFNEELRPEAFYFKQLELVLLACMGGAVGAWSSATPEACVGKAVFSLCVIGSVFALVAAVRPYGPRTLWSLPVKLYSLVLLAVMSALALASDLRRARDAAPSAADAAAFERVLPRLNGTFTDLANAVFGMSVAFLAILAGCFAFQIYNRVAVQVEAAARAAAVARFSRKEEHAAQGAAALLSAYRRVADAGEAGVAESESEDESSLPAPTGEEEARPQEAESAGQPARGLSRMAGSTRELQHGKAWWSRKAAKRAFFAPEASEHGAPQ